MSIINQMLRDLDTRNASEQERAGLPGRLRTLPPSVVHRRGQWEILVTGMAVGAAVVGLIAWAIFPASAPAPASLPHPSAPSAAAAAPVLPPAFPIAPPVAAPLAPVPPSPPPLAEVAAKSSESLPAPVPGHDKTEAKPAVAPKPVPPPLSRPTVSAPAARPVEKSATPSALPASAVPAPRPDPVRPQAAPATVLPRTAEKPAEAVAEAQIDKRPKDKPAPDLAESEYQKGMQAMKRSDHAAGLVAFKRALDLVPSHAKARQALLSVLVNERQWGEAQLVAQHGLALDPRQSSWASVLARLQFEQGDTVTAIDTLTRHSAHAQGDADYQGFFAYLLQKQQRPAEAAQRFRNALALRPQEGRWWFGLGLSLDSAGQTGEAREAYGKARDTGSLSPDMLSIIEQKLR